MFQKVDIISRYLAVSTDVDIRQKIGKRSVPKAKNRISLVANKCFKEASSETSNGINHMEYDSKVHAAQQPNNIYVI